MYTRSIANMKKPLLIFLTVFIPFFITGCSFREDWTLMVCKNTLSGSKGMECRDVGYVLNGYKTEAECMEKGIQLAKNIGFECGKNCKELEYVDNSYSCEVVCNKGGCK